MQISVSRFLCGKMGEEIKKSDRAVPAESLSGPAASGDNPQKRAGKLLPGEFRLRPPESVSDFEITGAYAGGRGLQRNGKAGP